MAFAEAQEGRRGRRLCRIDAVGLRELPDNPVLAPHPPARLYGRAQPNRLADFEFAHRYVPLKRSQRVYLARSHDKSLNVYLCS